MNKKGQALVEFILILPVLLLIIMGIIDVGNIFLKKYELGQELNTVSSLYNSGKEKELKAYLAKEELNLKENEKGDLITLTISKNVDVNALVLNNVLGKKHEITASKTIMKEDKNEQ